MNKYQEALDELDRVHQALYPLVTMYDNTGISNEVALTLNDIKPVFQELVDRTTPVKILGVIDGEGVCPKCLEHIFVSNFCDECGQALEKESEKEK